MAQLSYREVSIANGAAVSAEFDMRQHRLVAIDMPAAWTAASISFVGAGRPDGAKLAAEPFDSVQDSAGTEIVITAAASKYIVLTEAVRQALAGLARVKLVSGVLGTTVNQGAAREVILVVENRDSAT